jgi:hypothetical protein
MKEEGGKTRMAINAKFLSNLHLGFLVLLLWGSSQGMPKIST